MTTRGRHYDGGRLMDQTTTYDYVKHHSDGRVSAVSVTEVPARVCEVCGETFFSVEVTRLLVELLRASEPPAGHAVTVPFGDRPAA